MVNVPPVRIAQRIGIRVPVPVVGVPIEVHGPTNMPRAITINHHPLNRLGVVFYLGPKSSPARCTDCLLF